MMNSPKFHDPAYRPQETLLMRMQILEHQYQPRNPMEGKYEKDVAGYEHHSNEKQKELAKEFVIFGDLAARNELLVSNHKFIEAMVRTFERPGIEFLDLLQEAYLHILMYLGGYKEERGSPLTYLALLCRASSLNYLRRETKVPTQSLEEIPSMGDSIPNSTPLPDEKYSTQEDIARIVSTLPEMHQEFLRDRFWGNGHGPLTIEEIAKKRGRSKQGMEQLEKRILKKLRHPAKIKALREHP